MNPVRAVQPSQRSRVCHDAHAHALAHHPRVGSSRPAAVVALLLGMVALVALVVLLGLLDRAVLMDLESMLAMMALMAVVVALDVQGVAWNLHRKSWMLTLRP